MLMLIADGKVIIETGLDNFNTSHVNVNQYVAIGEMQDF